MDELIARVSQAAGIDADVAQKAIVAVLGFIQKEGPPAEVAEVIAKIPGAADLTAGSAEAAPQGGGLMGGLMGMLGGGGGGLMGLAGQLGGLGLGMGEMQAVGKEIFAFAREKAGEDNVGAIAAAIPGLGQFI